MIKLIEQKITELYESPGRQSRALFKTYKYETLHSLKKNLQEIPIRVVIRPNILHLNNFSSCCTYRDIQYRKPSLKNK